MRREATDLVGWPCSVPSTSLPEETYPVPLMLANGYRSGIVLDDYWVSEKLDGVRGYWDGAQLWTRKGNRVNPPAWFTEAWPRVAMDGELWAARGIFDKTSATVRREIPDDAAWRALRFMVFDLPKQPGVFTQRLEALKALLENPSSPSLRLVDQFKLANENELLARLKSVADQGGEGLMLHRGNSLYRAERNDNLLKLKPYEEDEACVIAHLPGKGRYRGSPGALLVERPDGLRFRIGTGITDRERRCPPPLGSWITYSHNGLTPKGIPRFASFVRIRDDGPPPAHQVKKEPAEKIPVPQLSGNSKKQYCLF